MKIICHKSDLLNSVNIVLKAVPARTSMPILECILISATEECIKFISNDMELGIETAVKGKVLEKGTVAINAKIFSDIVRKLPDNEVKITVDSNFTTKITCEKAKFNINGKEGDEFPVLPKIEKGTIVSLSQFTLKELIRQTVFSISDNENKKIMTGELFEIAENQLRIISLDGHRISIRKILLKENYGFINVIVPGKALNEVSKILSGELSEEVNMYFTDLHILFEFNDTIVLSRLIEGEYYKINQMLSCDYETKISINKREFMNCIERSLLLVKESEKKPVVIVISENNMELKMDSTIGSMNEEISIKKEGKDIMIGFNPKFILEALRVIDDDEISIYMINAKAPCYIKDKEESYNYIILPVNFNTIAN